LSYCYPTPERIREGVRRLAGVIDAELDVLETFGPRGRQGLSGPERPGISFPAPDLT